MSFMTDSNVAELVGWSLLHFVWQGALIAALTWFFSELLTSKRPNLRYMLCCVGLLVMAISPVTTMFVMSNSQVVASRVAEQMTVPVAEISAQNASNDSTPVPKPSGVVFQLPLGAEVVAADLDETVTASDDFGLQTSVSTFSETLIDLVAPVLPRLTLLWTIGVSLLSLKLIVSWFRVRRLRNSGALIKDPQLVAMLERLKAQLKMNVAIPLRESIDVTSPMVIGWLKPVILMPASAISGLSEQQLAAILVHELAHIRRADYLVNLLQSIVETLLFYHPAVWWLSSRIRQERENCCDDMAVKVSGDKRSYVTALLKLEQSSAAQGSLAVSSNGGDLVKRVARMLNRDRNSMGRSSWIAAVTAVAVVALLFAGSWLDASAAQASSIQEESGAVEKVDSDEEESDLRKIKVVVKTPDGKPLFNASITLGVWYKETAETLKFTTDKEGLAELPVPDDLRIYRLWADAIGYTPLFANWEEDEIKKGTLPPDEFIFKMIAAVEIGGIVVDKNDRPIEGVAVQVRGNGAKLSPENRVKYSTWYALNDSVKTDDQGRWRTANIPPGEDVAITLKLNHPDYIGDERWGDMQGAASIGLKELRGKTAKLVMSEGLRVRGQVTDEAGKPIEDALVVWGDRPYWQEGSQEIYTEADGSYETPTQKNGDLRITIMAPGFAPQTTKVTVGPRMKETDFVMSAGNRLELRFVDQAGKPVTAYAQIDEWRSVQSIYNYRHPNVRDSKIPIKSDDDGVYVWDWAPDDAVKFVFSARGYIVQNNKEIVAGDEPTTIVMKKPKRWSGKVTDTNGKPIPKFSVIPRFHLSDRITNERRRQLSRGKNGQFSININGQDGDYSLMFEAEGYETVFTEKFPRDEPPGELSIQLSPAAARDYRVVNENGEPVADATIVVASIDQVLSLQSYFTRFEIDRVLNSSTDSNGAFKLPSSKIPRTLMAVSREGFSEVSDSPDKPALQMTMRKWASLKYLVTKEGQPWLTGNFLRENRYKNGRYYHIQHYRMGSSDGDGIFKQKYVAPLPQAIDIFPKGDPRGVRYQIAFEPKPGEEFEIDFSDSSSFKALINFSGANSRIVDPTVSRFTLRRIEPSVEIPAELAEEIRANKLDASNNSAVINWFRDRSNFDALQCFSNCFDAYSGPLTKDGLMTFDVLRPGKYELVVSASAASNVYAAAEPLSAYSKIVDISAGVNDLGTLDVPVFEDPEPDSVVVNFGFTVRNDKTISSLEKYKGNYLLLDFWAPWSDKCGEYTPKIQRLAKVLAAKKKTTMISLMANGSGPVLRVPSKIPDGIEWIDGQVSQADERQVRKRLGVWNAQHFVLIDPEGKYVVGGSFGVVVKKMEELGLK